ncbi:MAG: hypothetical protein KF895_03060 [Parvibaculum sp.]|nr:hypothetical protein [Parvibaculum sp.]
MAELDALISRVRELEGQNSEVNRLVWKRVSPQTYVRYESNAKAMTNRALSAAEKIAAVEKSMRRSSPNYTASLDATISLIERELPGFSWRVGTDGPGDAPFGWVGRDDEVGHLAATPALALLLAFLTAIKDRDA